MKIGSLFAATGINRGRCQPSRSGSLKLCQFLIDTEILVSVNRSHRHRECKLVGSKSRAHVCVPRRLPVVWRRWRAPPTISSERARRGAAGGGWGACRARAHARAGRPAALPPRSATCCAPIKIRRRLLCHRASSMLAPLLLHVVAHNYPVHYLVRKTRSACIIYLEVVRANRRCKRIENIIVLLTSISFCFT